MALRPGTLSPVPAAMEKIAPAETGFWSNVQRSFVVDNWMGQMISNGMHEAARYSPVEGYAALSDEQWRKHPGFADVMPQLIGVQSPDEAKDLFERWERNTRYKDELAYTGASWSRFLGAIIADPLIFTPVPALKGLGFIKGAAVGGAAVGASGAIGEGILYSQDATMTGNELGFNIGVQTLFGSALGGLMGVWKGKGYPATTDARMKHAADQYDQAMRGADDTIRTELGIPDQVPGSKRTYAAVDEMSDEIIPDTKGRGLTDLYDEGHRRVAYIDEMADDIGPPKTDKDEIYDVEIEEVPRETWNIKKRAPEEHEIKSLNIEKERIKSYEARRKETIGKTDEELVEKSYETGLSPEELRQLARENLERGEARLKEIDSEIAKLKKQAKKEKPDAVQKGAKVADETVEAKPQKEVIQAVEIDDATRARVDAAVDRHQVEILSGGDSLEMKLMRHEQGKHKDAARALNEEAEELLKKVKEREDKIKAHEDSPTHKSHRSRWQREAEELKAQADDVMKKASKSTQTVDDMEVKIQERFFLDDPEAYDLASAAGVENFMKLFGSQMPYYVGKFNKFRKSHPQVGGYIARLMDRMAGAPGLRMRGAEAGIEKDIPVESLSYQWYGKFYEGKTFMESQYLKYMDIKVGDSPEHRIFLEQWKQEQVYKRGEKIPAAIRKKLGMADDPQAWRQGKLDYLSFRQEIGRAMINADKAGKNVPDDALPFVEASARRWRKTSEEMRALGEKHGMFMTTKSVVKKIERSKNWVNSRSQLRERHNISRHQLEVQYNKAFSGEPGWEESFEQLSDALKEYIAKVPKHLQKKRKVGQASWERRVERFAEERIKNLETRIEDINSQIDVAKLEIDRLEFYADRLKSAQEAGLPEARALFEESYFHRMFRLDTIEDNEELLVKELEKWFEVDTGIRVEGKWVPLSGDKKEIRYRAEMSARKIKREAELRNSDVYDKDSYVDDIQKNVDDMEETLVSYGRKHPGTVEKIVSHRGKNVAVDDTRPGKEGRKRGSFVRYDPDEGAWHITVDRDYAEAVFKKGSEKGVRGWSAEAFQKEFKTVDEFEEFMYQHELAHTRRRQGEYETTFEYEMRIDREARDAIYSGKPLSEYQAQLRERIKEKKNYLDRFKNSGIAPTPAMLRARQLSIPNNRLVGLGENKNIDLIETDVEVVMAQQIEKMAPYFEMADKFGDFNMESEMKRLVELMDEAIAEADPSDVAMLRKEKDRVIKATGELRDKVLKVYGIPERPDSWDQRTAATLKNFNVLAMMGKAFMSAIMDFGKIVMSEGFRAAWGGLFKAWAARGDTKAMWSMAAEEVKLAGLAAELSNGARVSSMFDLTGKYYGKTPFEKFVHNNAARMFILNGLSFWTDHAKMFAGSLIQSRMIGDSIKLLDGTLDPKQATRLRQVGISDDLARKFIDQWKRAGGNKDADLYLANTKDWDDYLAQRQFRAILGEEINNAVITPGAADKPNFMSTAAGSLILQYRGFGISATQRITMAGLQQKDMRVVQGLGSMVVLSWMIDRARRPDWSDPSIGDQIFRAVERSGAVGIFADFNQMLEQASGGDAGLRPFTGVDPLRGEINPAERVSALAGPAFTQWSRLIYALTDPRADGDELSRAIRYTIPYNNLWEWSGVVTDLQRKLGDTLDDYVLED